MSTWIKWWKSKFAWTLIGVTLFVMLIAFLFAYFFNWGWIVSIITAFAGGITLRKLIYKKIDNYAEALENKNKKA